MKLKEKVIIDFEAFFTFGKFDFLKLGKTKEWILNNFPDPDGFDENPDIVQYDIWLYGNIELHFNKDKLFMIFSDYINKLDGGNFLKLKKWFLKDSELLKLSDVIDHLNEKHIDFSKKKNHIVKSSVMLKLQSGVELSFHLDQRYDEENEEEFLKRCLNTNHNEFNLSSFHLSEN